MERLKKDIIKEMEEKSRENLNRGIDIAVTILKHEFPFITGWDYKNDPETYRSSIYLVLNADMNLASEFYNSPIRNVYKHADAKTAYPFSALEISTELNEEEKYELFKVIQKSLVEIYDEIPSELRHEFESYASEKKEPKELYIEGFIFEKPKENINESESANDKVSLAKSLIQQLFYEVSFIEQSTYNDRPLLTVYFDSDDTAANIESVFTHEICGTIKDYTSGEIKCNPSWGPKMRTLRNNPDILIDAILLEYDDEGNVLNESVMGPEYLDIIKDIVEIYKQEDTICDIEVSYDDEDGMYSIYIIFDSEELLKIRDRGAYARQIRNRMGEEIVKYIPDFLNFYVGSYARHCKESINENWYKVPSSDYNSLEKIINLTMKEKYWWWKDIKINTLNYIELYGDVQIEAELTVDEEWGANQWVEFYRISEFPGNKGWEDDGYELVRFGDIIDSTYAEVIRDNLREILKYTLNIDVYNMSFRNVYLIFE
jgi:hypothetical protein